LNTTSTSRFRGSGIGSGEGRWNDQRGHRRNRTRTRAVRAVYQRFSSRGESEFQDKLIRRCATSSWTRRERAASDDDFSALPTLWSSSGHRRPRITEDLPRAETMAKRGISMFRSSASPSPTGAWSASGRVASQPRAVTRCRQFRLRSALPPAALCRRRLHDPGTFARSANSWAPRATRALPGHPPVLFGRVVGQLGASGCARARHHRREAVRDGLASARNLTAFCSRNSRASIFRIDHYLGKRPVTASCFFALPMRCRSRFGTAITSKASR